MEIVVHALSPTSRNPAFRRVLGWTDQELLSRPFLDFVHPGDQAATRGIMAKLAAGEPTLHFENRYCCKDGLWRWIAWTCAPQPDGTLFASGRDVTDLKQAEEELRQTKQDLAITLSRTSRVSSQTLFLVGS